MIKNWLREGLKNWQKAIRLTAWVKTPPFGQVIVKKSQQSVINGAFCNFTGKMGQASHNLPPASDLMGWKTSQVNGLTI